MRKTMSIILMSVIVGTTVAGSVVSTPINVFAVDEEKESEETKDGKKYGKELGEIEGEIKGKKDALDKKPFDSLGAYDALGDIDIKFNIGRHGDYSIAFRQAFKEAFEKGYGTGYMDASTDKYNKAVIESIAERMGEHDATSDFYNKLEIDENRHRLSDREIKEQFIIAGGDSAAYEEVFVVLYRYKYEDVYRTKYRELRSDNFNTGLEEGKVQGKQSGQKDANFDFQNKITINPTKGILTKAEAVKRFNISYESEQFKENFYTGYRAEYKEAYEAEYRKLRGEDFTPGTAEGTQQGKRTGERDAKSDFGKKLSIDATRNILGKAQAIIEFKISDEINSFKENFYMGYITEYKKSYEAEYRKLRAAEFEPKPETKPDPDKGKVESEAEIKRQEDIRKAKEEAEKAEKERIEKLKAPGKELGKTAGGEQGELKGRRDFVMGNILSWEKAFRELGSITPPFNPGGSNYYLEGYKEGFKEGFEEKYNEAILELLKETTEVELGYAIETGEKDASLDFNKQLPLDSKRNLLSKEAAITRFNLTHESDQFKEYFYVGYMIEYKKAYEEKYRELRKGDFDTDRAGYDDGKAIGTKQGEFSGKIDFVTPGAPNNWQASINRFESQRGIIQRYFLDREPAEYRDSFIVGFREGYKEAYTATYKASNVAIAENNINYVKIAVKGGELKFIPSDGVGSLGGTLTIENATITQETHLGISMDRDSFNYKNLKYKPVNHVYNVAVDNATGFIELEKPMKLALEHYSTDELSGRAGIYQLVNNEWRYIHTDQKKVGVLEAEIPAGKFRGGKYAIFIDTDYKPIQDIKAHWASEELYTFLRRGYIEGYEKNGRTDYYPNTTMKRGHFVELLGKVLGWDYGSTPDNTSKFTDGKYFGERRDAINYAANMGYINGYPDGSFKPDNTLTYQQVEWILRSVMFDNQFKWDTYQQDIIKNKHTQPASVKDKKQPIKRGEVVYMLHEIQKKNLM